MPNSSISDYSRGELQNEERRAAQEKLENMLLEGLESGEPVEMTDAGWKNLRKEAMSRINSR